MQVDRPRFCVTMQVPTTPQMLLPVHPLSHLHLLYKHLDSTIVHLQEIMQNVCSLPLRLEERHLIRRCLSMQLTPYKKIPLEYLHGLLNLILVRVPCVRQQPGGRLLRAVSAPWAGLRARLVILQVRRRGNQECRSLHHHQVRPQQQFVHKA